MRLSALTATINELLALRKPGPEELVKACTAACAELRMLADDAAFFEQVRAAGTFAPALAADVRSTFDDLERFERFLEAESRVLLDAGLEKNAAQSLLRQARAVRAAVTAGAWDADAIRVGVSKLRNETCEVAGRLETLADADARRDTIRGLLGRAVKVLGGAALLIVNVEALATLGAAYSAASGALAVSLIRDGVLKS